MKFFVTFLFLSSFLFASNDDDRGSQQIHQFLEPHNGISVTPSEAHDGI